MMSFEHDLHEATRVPAEPTLEAVDNGGGITLTFGDDPLDFIMVEYETAAKFAAKLNKALGR